jgi:hypothetical protein
MWIAMGRDIKDVIGVLLRVLDGGEVSHKDWTIWDSKPTASETALNEAYVKLREFANDRT